MTHWPKTSEDKQLKQYWDDVGGTLYVEVTMGGHAPQWGGKARERRLDGVLVQGGALSGPLNRRKFVAAVSGLQGQTVDLIEAKEWLSRKVIGQSLVGEWMFKRQFAEGNEITTRSIILYRRTSPALAWVAAKLGIATVPFRKDGKPSEDVPAPAMYQLRERTLRGLAGYRAGENGGSYFTRVPLAGRDCGVLEWAGAERVWLPFVRVLDGGPSDIRIYEPARHEAMLRDASNQLELVFAIDDDLVRGHIGTIAARALMFERQYGRPFTKCTIVCKKTDPAVQEACENTGGTRGIPPVEVVPLEG